MCKSSFLPLEDLPDEILLNVFSWLDIKEVLQCGQVSRRLRAISNDQSLWSKLNIFQREIPYDFIEKAVQNGCDYLNLACSCVNGGKKSEVPWKLKYLEISHYCDLVVGVSKGVLQNCHFLQKLAVGNVVIAAYDIEDICQNGETLQILSLEGCNIDFYHRTELIEKLFTKCHQLTELSITDHCGGSPSYMYGNNILMPPHVSALVDNLTPNILKLTLSSQQCLQDEHVNTLVQKCNKIRELDLHCTSMTNDSVKSIIKYLNCLEKLDVDHTDVDFATLLQLKSIPTLKILWCLRRDEDSEDLKNLKLQLPHIRINEEHLHIACSTKEVNGCIDPDWIWEIRAKELDLFPKAY